MIGLGGTIRHTSDGGNSWQAQQTNTQVTLYGITDVAGKLFVSGGEGTILTLHNGQWVDVKHDKPLRLYIRSVLGLAQQRLLVGGVGGALHVIKLDDA